MKQTLNLMLAQHYDFIVRLGKKKCCAAEYKPETRDAHYLKMEIRESSD